VEEEKRSLKDEEWIEYGIRGHKGEDVGIRKQIYGRNQRCREEDRQRKKGYEREGVILKGR
jgi:hypothetical protein